MLIITQGHAWLKQRKDILSLLSEEGLREQCPLCGPQTEWFWEKSQVNCGADFHFTFPVLGFTREKAARAVAKHPNPVTHAGQWQGWGQQCVIFESQARPLLLHGTWRVATALGMVASLFRTTWGMTWWASVPWRGGGGTGSGWVGSTKTRGVSEQVAECLVFSADSKSAPKNLPAFLCPGFESSRS